MQIKHGIRSNLRAPGRAALTVFLFFLVAALLGTSIGTTWSVGHTLRVLSENYTTIAAAVLEAAPEEAGESSALPEAAAAMETLPLPDGALSWSPNRFGQAFLPKAREIIDSRSVSDYGVVLLTAREPGAFSERNTLPATAAETLFSVKNVTGKNLEVYGEGLEPGKAYLVYGRWYVGALGVAYSLEALIPPLEVPDPDHWRQTPGAQTYLDLAKQLEVRRYSVRAAFPEDPEISFPFQQKAVQPAQGRLFTPEELAAGARVCLIPEKLAKLEGLRLGDRLPLALALGGNPNRDGSYDPARGFDLEAEFEIVGILHAKEDWEATVFLPPQKELDLFRAAPDNLLGQFLLDNDRADAFLTAVEGQLPPGVRVTVYDQGYREAAEPLRIMLRTVSMITLVCLAAGLCFLLLNLWLFVSRQKQAGLLMHRLGAPRADIPVYFLSAMLALAIPALAGGVWFSHWGAGRITRRLGEALSRDSGAVTRFSDARLSLKQTVDLIQAPASVSLYWLIAGVLLALSVLICTMLAVRTVPRVHTRRGLRRLRTRTRTHALRGGASKYALLAAKRGGFRTAVTVLAPLAAALLLCGLHHTRTDTALRLQELAENSEIRGYFTNLGGTGSEAGFLKYSDLVPVAELPWTTHATVSQQLGIRAQIVTALEREDVDVIRTDDSGKNHTIYHAPHYSATGSMVIPEISFSSFQSSRLKAQSLLRDPALIQTDSMMDLPQTMFLGDEVQWLEGCSDENLQWVFKPDAADPAGGVQPDGSGEITAETGTVRLFDEDFYQTFAQAETWEAEQETIRQIIDYAMEMNLLPEARNCVVSDVLLKQWNLSLGGYFLRAMDGFTNIPGQGAIILIPMRIIGVYHGSRPTDPIFLPASMPLSVGEAGKALRKQYWDSQKGGLSLYNDVPVSSGVFRFRASDLDGLKQALAELNLTEVGDASGIRKPFLLEDQVFLATKRSVEQRLWYMERIFPVVSALVLLLALVLSVLQILARRREIWLMHCTGTGRGRAFGSLFAEQAGLCLLGLAAGLGMAFHRALLTPAGAWLALGFGALWLIGAGLTAAILTGRPVRTGRE